MTIFANAAAPAPRLIAAMLALSRTSTPLKTEPAAGVRGDLELAQGEEGRPLVDDVDAGIARRVELAGAGEAVGAHVDVAQSGHAVADPQELRLQPGAAGVAVVSLVDALADVGKRVVEHVDPVLDRREIGKAGVQRPGVGVDQVSVVRDRVEVRKDCPVLRGDRRVQLVQLLLVVRGILVEGVDLGLQPRDLGAQAGVCALQAGVVVAQVFDSLLEIGLLLLQAGAQRLPESSSAFGMRPPSPPPSAAG